LFQRKLIAVAIASRRGDVAKVFRQADPTGDWAAGHGRCLRPARQDVELWYSPFVGVRHQGAEFATRILATFALAQSQFLRQP
jgi:hypothetical protein